MRYFLPGIFDDVLIKPSDQRIRRIRYQVPVKGDPTITYDHVVEEMPTCEITMTIDSWRKIEFIMELYSQDIQNPALQDLADQYHMMRILGGK